MELKKAVKNVQNYLEGIRITTDVESLECLVDNAELMLKVSEGVPEERETKGRVYIAGICTDKYYNQGRAETLAGVCNRLEKVIRELIEEVIDFGEMNELQIDQLVEDRVAHILGKDKEEKPVSTNNANILDKGGV